MFHSKPTIVGKSPLEFSEAVQIRPQFVPHAAKLRHPLFLRAFDGGRIVEILMQPYGRAKENRAAFLRVVSDCKYVIESLPGKLIDVLRAMRRNVYAEFLHDRYRLGANHAWLCARAFHCESISGIMPQQAFGHLRPR